ncbi:protein of unknown function [Clostridium beijerinckii]|nr:protein of unknown function [Clostridium beijerinckii]
MLSLSVRINFTFEQLYYLQNIKKYTSNITFFHTTVYVESVQ